MATNRNEMLLIHTKHDEPLKPHGEGKKPNAKAYVP